MKQILQKLIQLKNSDFIEKIICLSQEEVIDTLHQNDFLKSQYREKVIEIYNEEVVNKDWRRNVRFADSLALASLLTPESRGFTFYFSCFNGIDFLAAYNCSQLGFVLNEPMTANLSKIVFDEPSRLAQPENRCHLEDGINYLEYLEKGFKPYLQSARYVFILYTSFVHHVKNGMQLSEKKFLSDIELTNTQSFSFNLTHYNNSIKLVQEYKKLLNFEHWPSQLVAKFYQDVNTPNPYNSLGIGSWENQLNEFGVYGKILETIRLKESFDSKFPIKGLGNKSPKI